MSDRAQTSTPTPSEERLERAARRAQRLADQLERDIGRVATARFFSFMLGASSAFAGWYDQAWSTYAAPALLGWAVFVGAMWRHKRLYALAPRAALSAQEHRLAAARLAHRWGELSEGGERFLGEEPAERELQVLGEVSLFKLLNTARLAGGQARLASLLKGALLSEAPLWEGQQDQGQQEQTLAERLAMRQEAAQELARKRSLRRHLSVELQAGGTKSAELGPLIRWAERSAPLPAHLTWLARFAPLLVLTSWSLLALELSTELKTLWQVPMGLQLLLFGLTTKQLSAVYAPLLHDVHKGLEGLTRAFERLERARFEGEGARRWHRALLERGAPSSHIQGLSKVAEALAVKHSALLYGVLALGFCWELVYGVRAWAWREEHGARLRRDLELLYDVEALASLGAHWADHAELSWPSLTDPTQSSLEGGSLEGGSLEGGSLEGGSLEGGSLEGGSAPLFKAKGLAHPLFDPHSRRPNDLTLTRGALTLITGSNMSGKSSLMRAVGANATLAYAGAPVVAQHLSLAPLSLATSIQVSDDPSQGWSRFYAEVRRIKGVIDRAEAAPATRPALYLIDEMLSGTNSRERRLASRSIADRLLAAPHATGLITTHDLDLAQLSERHPHALTCAHFSDRFDGERLIFDYTLKPGVATTTNALRVLWLEGVEVEGLEREEGEREELEGDE